MKNQIVFQLSIFSMLFLFFVPTAFADDVILSTPVENGYHYTSGNIETETDNCTISDVGYVFLIAEGVMTFNPGFTVENGAVFGVFTGTYTDFSETFDSDNDGTPDYWEFTNSASLDEDSTGDYDGDGLPDWYEFVLNGDLSEDENNGNCDCE